MKIVIPGGTGQVGRILCRAFASSGDEVAVLSRKANPGCSYQCVRWDGESVGDWAKELEDATAVINLAGRSVNCRYGKKNRREILDSRVNSVRAIRSALEKAKIRPEFGCRRARQRSTPTDTTRRMMNLPVRLVEPSVALPTHGDLAFTLLKRGSQQLMNPVHCRIPASSSCVQQ